MRAAVCKESARAAFAAERESAPALRITIVYDNTVYEGDVRSDWGFAAIIEDGDETLLFDTGANGILLVSNMKELGFDPLEIDTVVLSHFHGDHTGGLLRLLQTRVQPTVYLLRSFATYFKEDTAEKTVVVEVERGQEVAPGIFTTGEMVGRMVPEQSLVIPTADGLVVITGCGHPGIVQIAAEAMSLFEDQDRSRSQTPSVALAMGGFHLMDTNRRDLDQLIEDLRALGVQRVMPCHCTGAPQIAQFAEVLGNSCLEGGVGRTVEFEIGATDG